MTVRTIACLTGSATNTAGISPQESDSRILLANTLEERLDIRIDRLPDRAKAKTLREEVSQAARAILFDQSDSTSCLETWSLKSLSSVLVFLGRSSFAATLLHAPVF
jgi:hypothetical protein